MKRFHLHLAVNNVEQSIIFYSKLFNLAPTVQKPDYAKWMLDDPKVNFAISSQQARHGLDHLGIQVDSPAELETLRNQLKQAELTIVDEGNTVCCYSHSDKSWTTDPDGIAWETYHTMQAAEIFKEKANASACCTPKVEQVKPSSCGSGKCC